MGFEVARRPRTRACSALSGSARGVRRLHALRSAARRCWAPPMGRALDRQVRHEPRPGGRVRHESAPSTVRLRRTTADSLAASASLVGSGSRGRRRRRRRSPGGAFLRSPRDTASTTAWTRECRGPGRGTGRYSSSPDVLPPSGELLAPQAVKQVAGAVHGGVLGPSVSMATSTCPGRSGSSTARSTGWPAPPKASCTTRPDSRRRRANSARTRPPRGAKPPVNEVRCLLDRARIIASSDAGHQSPSHRSPSHRSRSHRSRSPPAWRHWSRAQPPLPRSSRAGPSTSPSYGRGSCRRAAYARKSRSMTAPRALSRLGSRSVGDQRRDHGHPAAGPGDRRR